MKVMCIDDSGVTFDAITKFNRYKVVKETEESYWIIDNDGDSSCWAKYRFNVVKDDIVTAQCSEV